MTDKEKTIKELKEALDSLDITNKYRLNLIRAIEYLQEEPVSEDLEEACEQLAENARKHKAETSSPFFSQTDYKQGVIDGAKWQKEHYNKYAKSSVLSGGQLQRVSIARSLACESKVILLDEATGALDIKMKREVQNILLEILNNSEKTILNVTHSVEEAVYLSTKIVILLPKPCRIYKTMDIRFDGEPPRDKWIFGIKQFIEYSKELTEYLEEVCSI